MGLSKVLIDESLQLINGLETFCQIEQLGPFCDDRKNDLHPLCERELAEITPVALIEMSSLLLVIVVTKIACCAIDAITCSKVQTRPGAEIRMSAASLIAWLARE